MLMPLLPLLVLLLLRGRVFRAVQTVLLLITPGSKLFAKLEASIADACTWSCAAMWW
jgi:hypothetical protein